MEKEKILLIDVDTTQAGFLWENTAFAGPDNEMYKGFVQ